MRAPARVKGPTLRVNVSGTISRRAKVGVSLMRLGVWLVRVGGVKNISVTS